MTTQANIAASELATDSAYAEAARIEARAAASLEADRSRIAADHAERNPGEEPFEPRNWIPKSRDVDLKYAEGIIAAMPQVTDKSAEPSCINCYYSDNCYTRITRGFPPDYGCFTAKNGKRVVMATSLTHPPVVDPEWLAIQSGESEADYIARIWPDIPEEAY